MRYKLFGRHPLTIGALVLLGLSIYEFWVRFEDFRAWFLGVHHLSQVRGTSFLADMLIIFEVPEMQQMAFKILYLLAMVIFAVICLICRNRSRWMWILFLCALMAAATGILLEFYTLNSWLQLIKLIPLALIAFGSISNQIARKEAASIPISARDNRQRDLGPILPQERSFHEAYENRRRYRD